MLFAYTSTQRGVVYDMVKTASKAGRQGSAGQKCVQSVLQPGNQYIIYGTFIYPAVVPLLLFKRRI